MAGMTPDQVAAEWAQRLAAATSKMQSGAQAVSIAPGQLAARNKAGYVAGVTANQDKWASRTSSVPLATWQNDYITKGLPRVASGATAAQPKMAAFMGQLLPYIASGRGNLPARGGLDANIGRMTAWVRYMAQFRRRGPGG